MWLPMRLLRGRGPEESTSKNDFLAKTGSGHVSYAWNFRAATLLYCAQPLRPTDLDMNHSHQDCVQKEYENCHPANHAEVRIPFDQQG